MSELAKQACIAWETGGYKALETFFNSLSEEDQTTLAAEAFDGLIATMIFETLIEQEDNEPKGFSGN